jgi:glutamyl-tRNA reductase
MRRVVSLLLVGASHRSADVDVRGRLADAASALGTRTLEGMSERLVLCTCHRVEVLAVADELSTAEQTLRLALFGTGVRGAGEYVHVNQSAIRHLSRVAAGLDSLIVGEAEISGQIRRAAADGRARGHVGPVLERVVAGVLRASGRARSETRIAQGTTSLATAAVTLLERAWGTIEGRSVLVVGAGEAARQALARLKKRRAAALLVTSRSTHHAMQAAERHGAAMVPLDELRAAVGRVDGVIAATRSDRFLIVPETCRPATGTARGFQLVDLSVPRVIDPAVAGVAGVSLHSVDDLGDVVRESVRRREREIPAVERIVSEESARTYRQFVARRDRRTSAVA